MFFFHQPCNRSNKINNHHNLIHSTRFLSSPSVSPLYTVAPARSCPSPKPVTHRRYSPTSTNHAVRSGPSSSCSSLGLWHTSTSVRMGPSSSIFFLVNPIYRAKMVIYVTRSIGCGDLRSGQIISCYCPNSCWDSGDCSLTLCSCGACKKDFRQRL